jgi:hypothetical protein
MRTIGFTLSLNGRSARKDIVRRLIHVSDATMEERVENGANWSDERDYHFIALRNIASDYGMSIEHVFAIAEYNAGVAR